MSTLPPEIASMMANPKWQAEKKQFDAHCAKLDRSAAPWIEKARWYFLGFTAEQRKAMGGDPDIAFQCELDGFVIRMDYSGEIGDGSYFWRKGHEAECIEEFEYFEHGTPVRPATDAELAQYKWALDSAIRDWSGWSPIHEA